MVSKKIVSSQMIARDAQVITLMQARFNTI